MCCFIRKIRLVLLLLIGVYALSACDEGFVIKGTIWGVPKQCDQTLPEGNPMPLEEAVVSMDCEESKQYNFSVKTDSKGHFEHSRLGGIDESCNFGVEKEGYTSAQIKVSEVCQSLSSLPGVDECVAMEFDATLTPDLADCP